MAERSVYLKIIDIARYLQATIVGSDVNKEYKGIKMDSREIEEGDLFLTYGKGIEYVNDAIKLGAVGIITDQNVNVEVPVLLVKDSLEGLTSLAQFQRQNYKGKVIAITGSNGKTSTKELLSFLLSFDSSVLSNFESENNHIGVPKTLLKANDSYDYVVLEMGMNHAGEIGHLSSIAHPDIGIITNIGSSHIGLLGSRRSIFKAKMELVEETPDITLFINKNDRYLKGVSGILVGEEYSSLPSVPSINVSLACRVCEYLGYKREEIERRLSAFPGVRSRMQKIELGATTLIDDAYNASYESVLLGLENLKNYRGRKLVIFGDILELGKFSERIHEKIYQEIQKYSDIDLLTIGEETSHLLHKKHFYSLEELKEYLKQVRLSDYCVIYLKASHKVGLSKLVPFFKNL